MLPLNSGCIRFSKTNGQAAEDRKREKQLILNQFKEDRNRKYNNRLYLEGDENNEKNDGINDDSNCYDDYATYETGDKLAGPFEEDWVSGDEGLNS